MDISYEIKKKLGKTELTCFDCLRFSIIKKQMILI